MIRWSLIALGGLIAAIAAVSFIGLGLPQNHSVTLSRDLPVPVAEVWERLTNLDDFARWRPDVDDVELIERPSNMLPAWRELGGRGVLTLEATVAEPLTRLVFEIIDEGQPFGGSWTYRLEPIESGTRLTITENGEIYNAFFRFIAKYVLGYEGTITKYLDALEADFQASRAP
ncbi:MAG: SRPBCC family protein [Gemmatimonadota bacterium]|nr:MAG: SRPBCC family protein [Gemmatimonadota bacterium]